MLYVTTTSEYKIDVFGRCFLLFEAKGDMKGSSFNRFSGERANRQCSSCLEHCGRWLDFLLESQFWSFQDV